MIKMGQMVEEVFRRYELEHEGCSVTWFAEQLHCDRRNVYDIFKRYTLDTQLLTQISLVLEYNFFDDLCGLIEAELRRMRESGLTHLVINGDDRVFFFSPDEKYAQVLSLKRTQIDAINTSYKILEKLVKESITKKSA